MERIVDDIWRSAVLALTSRGKARSSAADALCSISTGSRSSCAWRACCAARVDHIWGVALGTFYPKAGVLGAAAALTRRTGASGCTASQATLAKGLCTVRHLARLIAHLALSARSAYRPDTTRTAVSLAVAPSRSSTLCPCSAHGRIRATCLVGRYNTRRNTLHANPKRAVEPIGTRNTATGAGIRPCAGCAR